jgi:hypothetical protein
MDRITVLDQASNSKLELTGGGPASGQSRMYVSLTSPLGDKLAVLGSFLIEAVAICFKSA